MGKKRLLYGMMALIFVWQATAAYADSVSPTIFPDNPDPASCNIHVLAANLSAAQFPPGFTFLLAIHNYAGTTETFTIRAFLIGGTQRVRQITLAADNFAILTPADIPINPGEVADCYVCWRFGTVASPNAPGSVLLLFVGGSPTAIPAITFGTP